MPHPISNSRVDKLLQSVNDPKNDYVYRSGWNPDYVFAHQFKMGESEVRLLVTRLEDLGAPPKTMKAIIKELHRRSQSRQSVGGIALTKDGAKLLNGLAKNEKVNVRFRFNQPRPLHPIG